MDELIVIGEMLLIFVVYCWNIVMMWVLLKVGVDFDCVDNLGCSVCDYVVFDGKNG